MKVYAVYFSPTGGTKNGVTLVAREIAERLRAPFEELDFTNWRLREQEMTFQESDCVVFGTPVIAGRVPNLLLPFLTKMVFGNGALAVPMVSFGNRAYDEALKELRNILEQDGFCTVAAGAFVSPHSFSTTLGAARPDEQDKAEMVRFAQAVAQKIESGWKYESPIDLGEDAETVGAYYRPLSASGEHIDIRRAKPKTTTDCIGCGVCVSACPLGSIREGEPEHVDGICMKCCACVKACPMGAKVFDDAGFLFHKKDLEDSFGQKRAETKFFV